VSGEVLILDDGSGGAPAAASLGEMLAGVLGATPVTVRGEVDHQGVRLIVVPSDDDGRRPHASSVAGRLLHEAHVPVAVAPKGWPGQADGRLHVLGVAYDGSPESRVALGFARELAERADATVRVYTVAVPARAVSVGAMAGPLPQEEDAREILSRHLEEAVADLPPSLRALPVLLDGDAAKEIAGAAEAGVDLLVTGSRGYGRLGRVLLGSVSSALIDTAPCPVIAIPRPAADPATDTGG